MNHLGPGVSAQNELGYTTSLIYCEHITLERQVGMRLYSWAITVISSLEIHPLSRSHVVHPCVHWNPSDWCRFNNLRIKQRPLRSLVQVSLYRAKINFWAQGQSVQQWVQCQQQISKIFSEGLRKPLSRAVERWLKYPYCSLRHAVNGCLLTGIGTLLISLWLWLFSGFCRLKWASWCQGCNLNWSDHSSSYHMTLSFCRV